MFKELSKLEPYFPRRTCLAWLTSSALLVVGIYVFYPQVGFLKGCLLTGDHGVQHYPWAVFLGDSLSRGNLPWWTWKIHCGFPLLAEGQIGAFYPPNLLLHLLFTANAAYSLGFLLHTFLAGIFLLLYCRQVKLSWPSAALAALAFLYGNAFGGAYYNLTSLKTLCWFPLSLFFVEKIRATGRARFAVCLGVVFGLQLLAGYLQMAVYGIGMTVLYFLLKIGDTTRNTGTQSRFKKPNRVMSLYFGIRGGLLLLTALAVAAVVFLPQFLATYPLSRMSSRIGLEESFAYIGSFPPWGIVTLIFPKMEGLLQTLGIYVGILPLFLVFLSFGLWKEPSVRRWLVVLAVSLLLAMGGYSPLYVGLVKLTHFYGFRIPSKLLFFSNTALAILAGWGMEGLLRGAVSPRAWKTARLLFFVIGVGALFFILAGGLFLHAFQEDILKWGYAWVEKNIYGRPYHFQSLAYYRGNVDSYYRMALDLFRLTNPKIGISLFVVAVVLSVFYFIRPSWKRPVLAACCLGLVVGDLYVYHFINKLVGDFSTYAKETTPPASAVYLQQDKTLYRIYGWRGRFDELSLSPSRNMLFGIEDIGAYSPFVLRRYYDLLSGLGAADDSTGRLIEEPDQAMNKLPLLSVLNVKYVLAQKAKVLPGLEEVFATPTERIWRNPSVQDRFFFAQEIRFEKDPAALLQKVRATEIPSMRTVWLEEEIPPAGVAEGGGAVTVLEYGERRISLDVETPDGGFLFGSILYYPGVIATVNGAPARIFRANYCFCAIEVPPGRHRVVFAFDWKSSLRQRSSTIPSKSLQRNETIS